MKNYELLLMFNINQEESTNTTVDKYKNLITSKGGSIDRFEDWGAMKLAYNINKINKARYILLNFEASTEVIDELSSLIKFNDNIIRHMFLAQDKKITEPSMMMQNRERA
jgi:small subunit ribosomal protein S6